MKATPTALEGVVVIQPSVFADERGYFTELYREERYAELGLPPFVQDNLAGSRKDVLRGLHYQWPRPQGKLVYVVSGSVLDVAVDVRPDSPTFRRWVSVELSEQNHRQLWIPGGIAHGYLVLSESALVCYKCTEVYVPEYDRVVRWDDAEIGIDWPVTEPILSEKDRAAPALKDAPVLPDAKR